MENNEKTSVELFVKASSSYIAAVVVLSLCAVGFGIATGVTWYNTRTFPAYFFSATISCFVAALIFKAKDNHECAMAALAEDVEMIKKDILNQTMVEIQKKQKEDK